MIVEQLLFLAHRIPYPPTKGDKIRSYHILKRLARDYRVHLGAFVDDPADWAHRPALEALCASTCLVPLRPLPARARSLAALAHGEPLTLRYYRDSRLQSWVARLLQRGEIQRVFVFCSAMAPYVDAPRYQALRRVLDFVDLDSDKWRQYAASRRWPLAALYAREARTLFSYERDCAQRFDASVFVSAAEARLFCEQAPASAERVSFVENGVDADYFSPLRDYPNPYRPDERVVVFTGAMDYWANVDAVQWFVDEVLPAVRAADSRARFYIVGSRPTAAVWALSKHAGVCVTGGVPDVRPYLAHAAIAVAPLRIARGVQNKVLEAMAMGRPVVASGQAADGLRLDAGLQSLVCADAAAMARRVLQLLRDGDADDIGGRARAWVRQHYDWERNLGRIRRLFDDPVPTIAGQAVAGGSA